MGQMKNLSIELDNITKLALQAGEIFKDIKRTCKTISLTDDMECYLTTFEELYLADKISIYKYLKLLTELRHVVRMLWYMEITIEVKLQDEFISITQKKEGEK